MHYIGISNNYLFSITKKPFRSPQEDRRRWEKFQTPLEFFFKIHYIEVCHSTFILKPVTYYQENVYEMASLILMTASMKGFLNFNNTEKPILVTRDE